MTASNDFPQPQWSEQLEIDYAELGSRLEDLLPCHAFMAGQHPMADLAPRNVVARQVWRILEKGGSAFLHAQHLGNASSLRFPTVLANCLAH